MAKDPKRNPHPLAPTNTGNPAGTQRPRVAQVQKGMSVQKKTLAGGGEPATANPRKNIQERMGAKRRIEIKLPGPESPEATTFPLTEALSRPLRERTNRSLASGTSKCSRSVQGWSNCWAT